MRWSEKQILDTLRLIEASAYDEVKIETAGFKLHVRKSGAPEAEAPAGPAPQLAPRAASAAPALPPVYAASEASVGHPTQSALQLPEGLVAIRAPMIGTFYRASAPHAPPFVETGARVEPDDTVCLIEVMKLFNTIKAGFAGKVVKILAQNAATVKKDEMLLWIEPDRP
jgi:acetyl-CoA carboxylase biotin carboxyl carrier protein